MSPDRWEKVRIDPDSRLLELSLEGDIVEIATDISLLVGDTRLTLANASRMQGAGGLGAGENRTVVLEFDEPAIRWTLELALSGNGETVLLSSRVLNSGAETVSLGRCCLVDVSPSSGGAAIAGDDGGAVFLHQTGTTGHCNVLRATDNDGKNMSRTLLHLVSPAACRSLHLGFVTFDSMATVHEFTYDAAQGITSLSCVCDFEGYELAAGTGVDTETLMIEARGDVHASLVNWADRVSDHYKPAIWPKTPGGWIGWAWVDGFNSELYEDVVMRNARAIRRRLAGFDIEYIWVSIGNIKDGMPGDWLSFDLSNFPHGHEWLVSQLGDLGFKLGFWCGAFWLCSHLREKVEQMQDATLKRDGEPVIARPEWQYGISGKMKREDRPWIYALDPTHPKVAAFLTDVFATYRRWGIRYYMVDFLHAISGSTPGDVPYDEYHDMSYIKGPQVLRKGLQTVREAAGPETYLLSSSGPTLQNVGYVDACRVGNDYGEGRAIAPESYFYPATFVINAADFWTSHRHASDNMAANYYTHRKLYINDSGNVLTVDKPVPVCEAQISATIFALGGGPVMLGDDIDRMSEDRLALIKKVFPRTCQCAVPLDLFESPAPDYPKLFHQHIDAEWGDWEIVGVLNYSAEALTVPVDLQRLGLDPESPCRLWEFWNEQYLGDVAGQFEAIVPPRSARLYRIAAAKPHPWVLSTDMHAQQGQVELADVVWDADAMALSGKCLRPVGETGNLFIIAPKSLRVADPRGRWIAKDAVSQNLIIRAQIQCSDEPVEWSIGFEDISKPVDMNEIDLT